MLSIKEVAVNFLTDVASGKVIEAFEKYGSLEFKHHNVHYKGDLISLRNGMHLSHQNFPNKKIVVKNIFADGDTVITYSHMKLAPQDVGFILVHIFKIKNNKIIELWDMNQIIPEDSPNQNGAF